MSRTPTTQTAARRVANLERTLVRRKAAVKVASDRLSDAMTSVQTARADLKAARFILKTLKEGGDNE